MTFDTDIQGGTMYQPDNWPNEGDAFDPYFDEQRDLEEEEANRAFVEQEGEAELEAERQEEAGSFDWQRPKDAKPDEPEPLDRRTAKIVLAVLRETFQGGRENILAALELSPDMDVIDFFVGLIDQCEQGIPA